MKAYYYMPFGNGNEKIESHKENWKTNNSDRTSSEEKIYESHKENWKSKSQKVKEKMQKWESHKENWKCTEFTGFLAISQKESHKENWKSRVLINKLTR